MNQLLLITRFIIILTSLISSTLGSNQIPSIADWQSLDGIQTAFPIPPAIFFGPVAGAAVGDPVEAYIGLALCGQATVEHTTGLYYTIQVRGEVNSDGCGVSGRSVRLVVNGVTRATAAWNNTTSNYLPLPLVNGPTITGLGVVSTGEDTPTPPIPFTIGDLDTPADSLLLTPTSSNTHLVPEANIVLGGSGANRTLTVTPAADQHGMVKINIRVSDGITDTLGTLDLTVQAVNDAPSFGMGAYLTTVEDAPRQVVAGWATNISPGPADESIQELTFRLTAEHPELFSEQPAIDPASGQLSYTPAANANGTTGVNVVLTDNGGTDLGGVSQSAPQTFTITIQPVNDLPTLTPIADQEIDEDDSTGALTVTVSDLETPIHLLGLSARSSNPALLTDPQIILSGSGVERTVTVTPLPNQYGSATITLTLSDGSQSTSATFELTVHSVNDPPMISLITDQTVLEDHAILNLPLTLEDVDHSPAELIVTAQSSNTALLPDSGLVLSGSGANRFLNITPLAGQEGISTITILVSDGEDTSQRVFTLTVKPIYRLYIPLLQMPQLDPYDYPIKTK